MQRRHRLAVLGSLAAFCCSIFFVLMALISDHWVDADVIDGRKYRLAGFVHTGIFYGERDVDWGHGIISSEFSVFLELQDGVSFYARTTWIFSLFFVVIAVVWSVVGVVTCVLSMSTLRNDSSIAGPNGIYLWSLLSSISLGAALALFYSQYQTSLKSSMLLQEHTTAGFTTLSQASLGYAFYLMLSALCCLYIPPLVMVLCTERISTAKSQATFDPTLLLY